ncbi:DNA ligase D [Segetibacter sp. 3557_3]|uniref:DNA ligase D n=1 Tax=Segetibacter sp. 3557_3 TaxID=2547429 RepID=UPI0010586E90|nr:DNA ligase D [Segetibacter sp. 3557_3]TDH23037.1 DNA ligase D [Segetibacter sp. 3557_3]
MNNGNTLPGSIKAILKKGTALPFPTDVKPMLATLVDKPFDDEGWFYEVKWDGYRALAYRNGEVTEVRSRNNKSFNEKFYPVFDAVKNWNIRAVLDGEIVVVNDKGVPDFSDLQGWRSEADGHLAYYLFDVLWLEGVSLLDLPLLERREILRAIVPADSLIKLSENFEASGSDFFALADKMGLEGIMAKRATSLYVPDRRTHDWLKIKTEKRQEAVIGGYTKNENTSKLFSALLLGLYINGSFEFIGTVGTGYTNKLQAELVERFKPLIIKDCPFRTQPEYNKPSRFRPNPPKAEVTWVKPEVVCEISYREKTRDGAIRHPSFKGVREDKNAKDISWEAPAIAAPAPVEAAGKKLTPKTENALVEKKVISSPGKKERKTLLNPTDETQVRNIQGHDLKFTNLSKLYWPEDNVSKRDMLNYYYQVAPFILPYVKDKPQTLYRFPHGIHGEAFYQKDVKGKAPDWIETFPYHSYADGRDKEFAVITDEASLLYVASLGCIEINPWSSKVQTPDNPDWCIIDLDPDKNTFDQVVETACVTKKLLDAIGVTGYPKTSGSTGLHIYIPFGAKYDYEASKEFGRALAKIIHRELPTFTSIERKISDRGGKMYIDFLQNRPQATVAGPYSLRPKPGATVSMPLHWDEVKKGLSIKDFTIFNAVARLKEQGDIFKGVLGKGVDLNKVIKKLESL